MAKTMSEIPKPGESSWWRLEVLANARDALRRAWWGLLVAYAVLVVFSWAVIWAIVEPLGVPEVVPWWTNARWFVHIVVVLLVSSHAALLLEIFERRRVWQEGKIHDIDPLANRNEYLDTQINEIQSTQSKLVLFTSMMHRTAESQDATRVNAAMDATARRGIRARVIVAKDDTRLAGALELVLSGTAMVRFDPSLHLTDINYLCVDDRVAVLGERGAQANPAEYRRSQDWFQLRSRTITKSLTGQFEQRWSHFSTLTVEQMLRVMVPRDAREHSAEYVAEKLGISTNTIAAYLKETPLIMLVVGRPGSGKSTVAEELEKQLRVAKIDARHVSDIEFFLRLFAQPVRPECGFAPTADGGYIVTDARVWERATESLAASVTALPATTDIAIVECARSSYSSLLDQLASKCVRPDFVTYIDTPYEIAVKRNAMRRGVDGRHYVSKDEMEKSYRSDDVRRLRDRLGSAVVEIPNEHTDIEATAAAVYNRLRDFLDKKIPSASAATLEKLS